MMSKDDDNSTDDTLDSPQDNASADGDEKGTDSGNEDFVPWNELNIQSMVMSSLAHRTIVKNRHIEADKAVVITPKLPIHRDDKADQGIVTPILENEQIVGVRVECHCGSIHEIMFDFAS